MLNIALCIPPHQTSDFSSQQQILQNNALQQLTASMKTKLARITIRDKNVETKSTLLVEILAKFTGTMMKNFISPLFINSILIAVVTVIIQIQTESFYTS